MDTIPPGDNGAAPPPPAAATHSSSLEVPLSHSGEIIELDLEEMFSPHQSNQDSIDQLDEVVNMLTRERVKVNVWTRFIQECWTRGRYATALHYADKGLDAIRSYLPSSPSSQSPLYLLKASYHLSLSRLAPKTRLQSPRTTPLALPKDPHHPESLHAQEVYPGLNRGGRTVREVMGKEDYWYRVEKDLDRVGELERGNKVERDLRAALAMARGKLEESNRLFEQILLEEPTHLMALTGRARILFSKLSFRPALKIYQQILTLQPTFLPDPRIGIGLCFWFLGDREKARKAWERSISINPTQSTSAQTLLGLLHLNRSRDPLLPGGSKNRLKAYELGIGLVQQAFKRDNTLAACMGPLGNHLLIQNSNGQGVQQAMKLFERSLQFSETRLLIAESHFNLARSLDADSNGGGYGTGDALTEYQRAVEANPDMVIAHLGVGGCYIRTEQFPAAINAFETLLRKHPQTVEALVSLASIHTHLAFTFHSVSDSAQSRKAAKESYEQVLRIFAQGKGGGSSGDQDGGEAKKEIAKSERIRQLANDREMFIEMARLWSDEVGVERSLKAWQEARRIQVESLLDELPGVNLDELDDEAYQGELEKVERMVDARVRNNIGVLLFNKKSWDASMGHFELAFETIGKEFGEKEGGGELDGGETDAVLTMVTFNLACCYEKLGMKDKAREGWENVLRGHPEFVDAKARLALLELSGAGKKDQASWDRAHVHLKEALTSQPHSPELRALYTYFLFETFQHRQARDFARSTLKEVSRHDLYALCASGIISYLEARENKQDSKEAVKERQARYLRSAEFFDKALQLDPMCAIAAQGLAIGLAEGALGNSNDGSSTMTSTAASANGSSSTTAVTDAQSRQRNARDALLILTKVKESINDASVYVNIGHCHIARDEFERAAENYTTASKRYLEDKSSTVLWYLSRAWYFKALKESSFVDLEKAIHVGQQATDLYPTDLSNIFNMAVLKQKAIEILYGKSNETRTSVQLRKGFEYLESSQSLFEELVKNQTAQTPYQKDFPRLRSGYGRSLQGRFQSILEQQLAYEETEAGKINQARQAREEARNRQLAEEAKKESERQRQNEALAEQRKKMREETNAAWASMSKEFVDSDEEGEKKKKGTGGGKKRKATKLKGGEEAEASSTDEEGNEKPAKKKKAKKEKKPKKAKGDSRAMDEDDQHDPDDEDAPIRAPGRKRKGKSRGNNLIKSTEFVEDSEEDE